MADRKPVQPAVKLGGLPDGLVRRFVCLYGSGRDLNRTHALADREIKLFDPSELPEGGRA